MRNQVSDHLCDQFAEIVGGREDFKSGQGTRFRSARLSRFTVYHGAIAPGNSAEVAFHPASLAQSTGIAEAEIRAQINRIRISTGREINFNSQHKWPRVGVSTEDHAAQVLAFLNDMRAVASVRHQAG